MAPLVGTKGAMTRWTNRHPMPPDEEIARWTLDRPPALEAVRAGLQRAVRAHAPKNAADLADLAERLMIAATELAGNALRHGKPPTVVALLRADGHLIIDVTDNDPTTRPTVDPDRRPGSGGLGLTLTQRLAQEVGWYPTDTDKHVWAQFTIAADRPG
ncbi:ATP-binding protein [Actinoplanes sp. NPDC026623]|uniref:ATP-binding protein n=1 Tax=Actinoplanes sp. NPDC026623 TaxID=3155610 RepID=UPI0034085EE8